MCTFEQYEPLQFPHAWMHFIPRLLQLHFVDSQLDTVVQLYTQLILIAGQVQLHIYSSDRLEMTTNAVLPSVLKGV